LRCVWTTERGVARPAVRGTGPCREVPRWWWWRPIKANPSRVPGELSLALLLVLVDQADSWMVGEQDGDDAVRNGWSFVSGFLELAHSRNTSSPYGVNGASASWTVSTPLLPRVGTRAWGSRTGSCAHAPSRREAWHATGLHRRIGSRRGGVPLSMRSGASSGRWAMIWGTCGVAASRTRSCGTCCDWLPFHLRGPRLHR
jgi:hypothetical protein